ncbi:ScbR family autoregulator-binding transcription factor [Lysinibacter cavernae]|uniref:AcrR family transcriptional regulator n=1 Tax=Lysinibacter cavernae TaxID=1640652 RepID=A0A7X5QZ87_9MICO|nr:ScbR family autoregulator-binding transcription factor [Lysinibacter cavernae]NIH52684.1 AcrR family transcriptional regulator [Lysinibacter cavernae]
MQQRAIITRQNIVNAASQVFVEHGFAAANIADVTSIAGITKGAMYFHFKSKEDLARAVIDEQQATYDALQAEMLGKDLSAFDTMIEISYGICALIKGNALFYASMRIAVELGVYGDPISKTYAEWGAPVAALVAQAIDDGDIRSTVDPEAFASFVISAFTGIQTVSMVYSNLEDLDGRIMAMWDILLPGMVTDKKRLELAEQTPRAIS